jgi:hypothetical protein
VLLTLELGRAWRAAPSVRRGRITGVVLAAFVIVGVLVAGIELQQLAQLERFMKTPPTIDEIEAEPISIHLGVQDSQLELDFTIAMDKERHAHIRNEHWPPVELEVPEAALDRFRALLARGRYCEIDGSRPFLVDLQPPNTVRWLTVSVGLHSHEIVLFGRAEGLERWPSDAPPVEIDAETLRRILDTWDEALSWFEHPTAQGMRRWEDRFLRDPKPR